MKPGFWGSAILSIAVLVGCSSSARPSDPAGEEPGSEPAGPTGSDPTIAGGPPATGDFAACATATAKAEQERLPVDIIWVVDSSVSMAPAAAEVQKGLNAFAQTIATKNLDYNVILLGLRGNGELTIGGNKRYGVCVPQPLAGNTSCGNGPRFFHSSVDIRSTQPLEQLLGTLDQTPGYKMGEERGGEPWAAALRPEATKTIVVVTDDNSRLSAVDFEKFAGGTNPHSSSFTLPPGLLHPSRAGKFDDYVFAGLYGWDSMNTPTVRCQYPDGSSPPASGMVYSELVQRTAGPRAKICDGSPAWSKFFDDVAQSVEQTSKLSCDMPLPEPASGRLDPEKVNVELTLGGQASVVPRVASLDQCGTLDGFAYDDPANPTRLVLCPATCESARSAPAMSAAVNVVFGCETRAR